MTTINSKTQYLTVKQMAAKYPFLKESGWRWRILKDMDFKKACVRKFGRRVLINEVKLIEYLEDSLENN